MPAPYCTIKSIFTYPKLCYFIINFIRWHFIIIWLKFFTSFNEESAVNWEDHVLFGVDGMAYDGVIEVNAKRLTVRAVYANYSGTLFNQIIQTQLHTLRQLTRQHANQLFLKKVFKIINNQLYRLRYLSASIKCTIDISCLNVGVSEAPVDLTVFGLGEDFHAKVEVLDADEATSLVFEPLRGGLEVKFVDLSEADVCDF